MVKSACRVLVPALSAVLLTLVAGCDSGTPGRSSPPWRRHHRPPPSPPRLRPPPLRSFWPSGAPTRRSSTSSMSTAISRSDLRFACPNGGMPTKTARPSATLKCSPGRVPSALTEATRCLVSPSRPTRATSFSLPNRNLSRSSSYYQTTLRIEGRDRGIRDHQRLEVCASEVSIHSSSELVEGDRLIYVHWEGPLLCEISMEDIEPGYEESEDICTASVLTFRKKK